ncbi:MAG TPA: ABC transporter permease [Vicinamibacterales bacterium]|nr:ABC transporter permease [Vicinamibacterales bacterium]
MEGWFSDLRFALRRLRRDRTFTLAAVAMLALAIGLNVTVFAIMDAMLFRGFPLVRQNHRLVYLQERSRTGICCISYRDFEDWRAQARTFEAMAFVGERRISLSEGPGRSIDTMAFLVSSNAFGLLGVPPLLGRDFTAADEQPGAAPVAILNYRFWDSHFGKRADIVGLTVRINREPATIVGVMQQRFDFPTQEDVWMPVTRTAAYARRGLTPEGFTAVGRLRTGVRLEEARAELETINRRLETEYPATNRGLVPTMAMHAEMNSGPDAPTIWGSLWAAACLVLLIACANLAQLTLVRTMGRWREFATRMALGASRARMIRQVLVESALLAAAAGAIGWSIATWSVRVWALTTASRYQVLDYSVDARTLAYLLAVTIAAAILSSLAPIGRIVHLGIGGAFGGDARGVTHGGRGRRLAMALVAGQMTLAIVLLSGTGVLVRSLLTIVRADTGVRDPDHVLVGRIRLPSERYPAAAAQLTYFDQLETRLRSIPGVEDVAVATTLPVNGVNARTFEIEGAASPLDDERSAQVMSAGAAYFRVVGAPPIAGREFDDGDRTNSAKVAVVNQSFVARFWPGEEPLGRRLRLTNAGGPGEWRTVVGVVPNIMQGDGTRQRFRPLIYVPFRQDPIGRAFFLARTRVPPDQVAPAVRADVQAIDPGVGLEGFMTLKASFAFDRDRMDAEHSELGKHAAVAPVFAATALLLAAIGLVAVIAHSVSQRTREIGVRMAIGAAAADVSRMIVREGMLPVAIGMAIGLAASPGVNRLLRSQLVGVSPYDPLTMAAAPALLFVVGWLACQIPARQAVKVDPAVALRHDG